MPDLRASQTAKLHADLFFFDLQDRSSITPETIIAKAQAIMAPYKLEVPFVDWWTV